MVVVVYLDDIDNLSKVFFIWKIGKTAALKEKIAMCFEATGLKIGKKK